MLAESPVPLPAEEVEAACRACGAATVARWQRAARETHWLRHCAACDVARTMPEVPADELSDYYGQQYYGPGSLRFAKPLERAVAWFRQRRALGLHRQAGRPGKVLDIGCGRGWTLTNLRASGWDVQGVELSREAAEHARQELKLPVATDGFDAHCYPTGEFDLVIVWHVLKHLPYPLKALDEIARFLKPGGMLALAAPNLDGLQARLTRWSWFHLDLPRHRAHFTAAGLRRELAQRGLHAVREEHSALEQNVFGWIQSVLNLARLEHNLLYDLLRSRPSRRIRDPWREVPFQSGASLIGLVGLFAPALVMVAVEAIIGRGGTVDLYAIRQPADTTERFDTSRSHAR
ncbi:MAG TPA: class I SAM-dependent methyltransferase [Pirellulales bacterium]|jgi:SAM-dependent methyltransferase|nr:class I SAM-dependent methyltransferase [Pirellulales bacterium]